MCSFRDYFAFILCRYIIDNMVHYVYYRCKDWLIDAGLLLDGWIIGWINGWINGWMYIQVNTQRQTIPRGNAYTLHISIQVDRMQARAMHNGWRAHTQARGGTRAPMHPHTRPRTKCMLNTCHPHTLRGYHGKDYKEQFRWGS